MVQDGRRVTGDKIFPLAHAQHDTTGIANASRHDLVRLIGRDQDDHIGALDLLERFSRRFDQSHACCKIMLHKKDDGLGIRIRLELDAFGGQLILELQEIFHDPVLDDNHPLRLPEMRMGVAGVGCAVRCPACMTDPGRTVDRGFIDHVDQLGQFTRVLADLELAAAKDSETGRVVAAVFEPLQAIENDRCRIPRPDISDDSTHRDSSDSSICHCEGEARSNLLITGDCFAKYARSDRLYATPCLFVRAITQAALQQGLIFGGKDKTGDGAPEGLPLICRFSPG